MNHKKFIFKQSYFEFYFYIPTLVKDIISKSNYQNMKKVLRMFKSFLARKKRKKTKEVIETLEKRQRAHIRHQKEKIKKFPNNYSKQAKESLTKKLKVG